MKNLNVLALLLVFVMFACQSDEYEKKILSTYPDKSPQVVQYYEWVGNRQEVRKEVRFFRNGQEKVVGHFKDGQKHGSWTEWYPNGEKWTEFTYEQGRRHGPFTVWFMSGKVNYSGGYKDGLPHGKWIYYDGRGNKQKQVRYDAGKKVDEKIIE